MANDPTQETDVDAEELAYRRNVAVNLRRWMIKCGQNQSTLADLSGVGQSTIGRYLRSEVTANSYTLSKLADALNISVSHLTADSTRLGVDHNVINPALGQNLEHGPKLVHVPLISWSQLGAWQMEKAQQLLADGSVACPVQCGPKTFAVRVRGVSMEPKFADGDIIFVDPDVSATHGKRVIAQLEGEMVFRELVLDGDRRFLTMLNNNFPGNRFTELPPTAHIVGVVVGKWVPET